MQEISNHQPFLTPAGKACEDAWDKLVITILEDSTRNGSVIDRTGNSCHSRFKRLVDAHKVHCYVSGMNILILIWAQSSETCSLQKTGTNEEIDSHIEVCYLLFCDIQAVLSHFCKDYDRIGLAFGCTVR